MIGACGQDGARPQQEPGPAQPDVAGDDPQQPVSFAPGTAMAVFPVRLLVLDMRRSVFELPQDGQASAASPPRVMTSPVWPQSRQMIS
jgi:hypothetical protein